MGTRTAAAVKLLSFIFSFRREERAFLMLSFIYQPIIHHHHMQDKLPHFGENAKVKRSENSIFAFLFAILAFGL